MDLLYNRNRVSLPEVKRPVRGVDLMNTLSFFFKRFTAQKIGQIHRVTKLQNCSFNQFAFVVPRRASDREFTALGTYKYSSEKQVQRKNTAAPLSSVGAAYG